MAAARTPREVALRLVDGEPDDGHGEEPPPGGARDLAAEREARGRRVRQGRREEEPRERAPGAPRALRFAPQRSQVVEVERERVRAVDVAPTDAEVEVGVLRAGRRLAVGAEQAVPDDQRGAVVAEVPRVGAVVQPVGRGRHQHPAERAERHVPARVHEEVVDVHHRLGHDEGLEREPQERHRRVEQPRIPAVEPVDAHAGGEVERRRGVVGDVAPPQDVHAVRKAVVPVLEEVRENHRRDPRRPGRERRGDVRHPQRVEPRVARGDRAGERRARDHVPRRQVQVPHRVRGHVPAPPGPLAVGELHRDGRQRGAARQGVEELDGHHRARRSPLRNERTRFMQGLYFVPSAQAIRWR